MARSRQELNSIRKISREMHLYFGSGCETSYRYMQCNPTCISATHEPLTHELLVAYVLMFYKILENSNAVVNWLVNCLIGVSVVAACVQAGTGIGSI